MKITTSPKLRRGSLMLEQAIQIAIAVALAGIVFLALTGYLEGIFDNLGAWVPGAG